MTIEDYIKWMEIDNYALIGIATILFIIRIK